jgi:2-succinyl-5-enolpyruvyl-6-hydroxy-3-cyclohexene-1-carboxylate synthase
VVLRFGKWPASRPFYTYLERHRQARHVLFTSGDWEDPSHLSTDFMRGDPTHACHALAQTLGEGHRDGAWLRRWLALQGSARQAATAHIERIDALFEGRVFAELHEMLSGDTVLFAGSSMPVRDLDTFFPRTSKAIACVANRGVNGIDGVVSSALGYGVGSGNRVVLVIGDISFYHDMNGLLAAKRFGIDATIVVINNDGGGIFNFLPQAQHEHFEQYFGTPHGLTYAHAAAQYGLPYAKVASWSEFREAVKGSFGQRGTSIVEVPAPDRRTNVELHQQIAKAVVAALPKAHG